MTMVDNGSTPPTRDKEPTARTRNAAATRQAILQAARCRFASEGYDGAGLRDIAADAGVDAALVSRYFGSKEELFKEVLGGGEGVEALAQGDVAGFGERLAHMLVYEPRDDAKLAKIMIMLRSASSPKAADTVRELGRRNFYGPFEAWLGGENAAIRCRLATAILMGFSVARALDDTWDDAQRKLLCERLAVLLQEAVS